MRVLLSFISIFIALGIARGQSPTSTHQIYIKFKVEAQAYLPTLDADFKKIGDPSFDALTAKYRPVAIQAVITKSAFARKHQQAGLHLWYVVQFPNAVNTALMVQEYKKNTLIATAEQVYEIVRLGDKKGNITNISNPTQTALEDPLLAQQWQYESIHLQEVWKNKRNASDVIIALMDRSVDTQHEDLQSNIWKDKKLQSSPDYQANKAFSDPVAKNTYMGTSAASIIVAQGNNGKGIAGVAGGNTLSGGAQLMLCDVGGAQPNMADAFVYGADNGAVIFQLDWHYVKPGVYNQVVYDALRYFVGEAGQDQYGASQRGTKMKGGIVFAAAGDQSSSSNFFPQAFEEVLTVGALNRDLKKANYSNTGSVRLWAPGGDAIKGSKGMIVADFPDNKYDTHLGTALACAQVTGVAALLISQYGNANFTPEVLICKLLSSSQKLDDGRLNGGLLDAQAAFYNASPPVSGLTVDQKNIELLAGEAAQLKVGILPTNACGRVTWISSRPNVASVSPSGRVNAFTEGTTDITASLDGFKVTAGVTVKAAKTFKVTGISLTLKEKQLDYLEEFVLQSTLLPSDASNKTLVWTSSNPQAVSVKDGRIKGILCGGASSITVTTADGGYSAVCVVRVGQAATGIDLSRTEANLQLNEVVQLAASILPNKACKSKIKWTSSNANIASVDSLGKVKALACGSVSITAYTDNGLLASAEVNVGRRVTGVSISDKQLKLNIGDLQQLTSKVLPKDACNRQVEWVSSDPKVLTVDPTGNLKALACGAVRVTVITAEGRIEASCDVEIGKPVSGISLSENVLALDPGTEMILQASALPAEACNKNVNWSSSNPTVVRVDQGKIKALVCGDAVITVSTAEGDYSAKCVIRVGKSVSGISLAPNTLHLAVGASQQLQTQIQPTQACNTDLIWVSTDPRVATVSDKGLVSGLSCGTASISASTVDGGFSVRCDVKVGYDLSGLSLSNAQVPLQQGQAYQLQAQLLPSNACPHNLMWVSSRPDVVSVDGAGKLMALSCGKSAITVSITGTNYSAICEIEVGKPVSGIRLLRNAIKLQKNREEQLHFEVLPVEACNRKVNWVSSNPAVAKVGDDGKIKALAVGKTSIKISTVEGNFTADCEVEVTD